MTATIRQGRYQGLSSKGVTEYRGVPFARAPLGEWRFKTPQPLPDGEDSVSADRYPLASLQPRNPVMGIQESGEDCLYLNIWVPEGEGPFPVMVWFHGGGYMAGSTSQVLYNGAELARSQNVVVVNAAYRLGAMGFADFSVVAPELEADTNLGLRDQLAALQWVQENIAAFAGDDKQVTIFGESAGGFSVCALLACPQADNLFQAAIVQSGGADFVLAPDQVRKVTDAFVAALPGDGSVAEKLLSADNKGWVKAQNAAVKVLVDRGLRTTTPQFAMNFLPMVDGDVLPQLPVDAIAAGAAANKRVMAGVCRDEFNFFQYAGVLAGTTTMAALKDISDEEIVRRFERALPGNGRRVFDYYQTAVEPDARRSHLDWLAAMESDRLFRVPTVRLLDAQSQHAQCWGFQFTWPSEPFGVPLGACHVVDVPFVFGVTDTPAGMCFTGGTTEARALSHQVQAAWGTFARGDAPGWDAWQSGRQVRQLGPGETMASLLDERGELLWRDIIPVA